MSVFRVKLQNGALGALDIDPTTGLPFATSHQRTIMVTGPKRIQRQLTDGETFTDNNYWKQFDFIEVVSDDGSVYSDVESENTYPVAWLPGPGEDGVLESGAAYDDDYTLDIVATYGGPATFIQIVNYDGDDDASVRLNGLATATFTVAANATQVFNAGDLAVSKIAFANPVSGVTVNHVEVVLAVKNNSTS